MKLLGSSESKITEDNNGENVPRLEIPEVVSVQCNIVNNDNDYQQDSRIYNFVPNNPFGSLLEILPRNHIILIQNFKKSKYGLQIKMVNH